MKLIQSSKKNTKIKIALQSISSGGKTYSALLLAKGLSDNNFSKVAIIDTENCSADLYAHLGGYNVLKIEPPFSPENYIEAIELCEKAGMEVIIIDSISHCWEYLLEVHKNMPGNSFTNWGKITPRHNAFVYKLLRTNAHIISTMRVKQDYVLTQKNGKFIPEKVGLRAIQRSGIDYEFTLVFDINSKHFAVASKDRTGLFLGRPEFLINTSTGKRLLDWCNSTTNAEDLKKEIDECLSIGDLMKIYKNHPNFQHSLKGSFQSKKNQLETLTKTLRHENINNTKSNHK